MITAPVRRLYREADRIRLLEMTRRLAASAAALGSCGETSRHRRKQYQRGGSAYWPTFVRCSGSSTFSCCRCTTPARMPPPAWNFTTPVTSTPSETPTLPTARQGTLGALHQALDSTAIAGNSFSARHNQSGNDALGGRSAVRERKTKQSREASAGQFGRFVLARGSSGIFRAGFVREFLGQQNDYLRGTERG